MKREIGDAGGRGGPGLREGDGGGSPVFEGGVPGVQVGREVGGRLTIADESLEGGCRVGVYGEAFEDLVTDVEAAFVSAKVDDKCGSAGGGVEVSVEPGLPIPFAVVESPCGHAEVGRAGGQIAPLKEDGVGGGIGAVAGGLALLDGGDALRVGEGGCAEFGWVVSVREADLEFERRGGFGKRQEVGEVDVECLVNAVARDLEVVDALGVVGSIGTGDGKEPGEDFLCGDVVDGEDLGADRQLVLGGEVFGDDHSAIEPAEIEGDAVVALEESAGDGLLLIEEVGVGVTAADGGGETGEGKKGFGEGLIVREGLLEGGEASVHLGAGVVAVEAGVEVLVGVAKDGQIGLEVRGGEDGLGGDGQGGGLLRVRGRDGEEGGEQEFAESPEQGCPWGSGELWRELLEVSRNMSGREVDVWRVRRWASLFCVLWWSGWCVVEYWVSGVRCEV